MRSGSPGPGAREQNNYRQYKSARPLEDAGGPLSYPRPHAPPQSLAVASTKPPGRNLQTTMGRDAVDLK
eukprot:7717142-Pyramimonas_sp.AAC.1